MFMTRKYIYCLICSAILACTTLLHGEDELDKFSRNLDRLEDLFWDGIFSSHNYPVRNTCNNIVDELSGSARLIHQLRREASEAHPKDELGGCCKTFNILLNARIVLRKKRNYVSYMRKTNSKQSRGGSRRDMSCNSMSLSDYRYFLDGIRDYNLKMLEKNLRGRRVNNSQREFLQQTAEKYYTALCNARYMILKLRKTDPAFKK